MLSHHSTSPLPTVVPAPGATPQPATNYQVEQQPALPFPTPAAATPPPTPVPPPPPPNAVEVSPHVRWPITVPAALPAVPLAALEATLPQPAVSSQELALTTVRCTPNVIHIPVDYLKPHLLNAKLYAGSDSQEYDEQLRASIEEHGVMVPLIASAEHVVVSGHRRLCAARAAGRKTVPVTILDHQLDALTVEELLLEANRTRMKNNEQRVREFMVYKRIEVERAKARMEHRADPVLKSTQAGTQQDAGKARDLAAKKVGMAWAKAEHGEAVVVAIDRLQAQGNVDAVKRLREVLNTKTIETAYREAVKHGWIVMPGKRPPRKRAPEANDGGSKVPTLSSDREPSSGENAGATQDPAKDDGPSPTSEHPSAVSDVNEKEDRVVDYKAPTPGTTPSKDSEGQSAPVKSTTVSANPARGTPPPSFENDVAALSPPVAPGQEGRPRDTGGHTVDTTEVRHLITADKVDQAVSAVRPRELVASDGIDLSSHVRLLVPAVARLLNAWCEMKRLA